MTFELMCEIEMTRTCKGTKNDVNQCTLCVSLCECHGGKKTARISQQSVSQCVTFNLYALLRCGLVLSLGGIKFPNAIVCDLRGGSLSHAHAESFNFCYSSHWHTEIRLQQSACLLIPKMFAVMVMRVTLLCVGWMRN
jgi:hypothetical protein